MAAVPFQTAMLCAKAVLDQLQQHASWCRANAMQDKEQKRALGLLLRLSLQLEQALLEHRASGDTNDEAGAQLLLAHAIRAMHDLGGVQPHELMQQLECQPQQVADKVTQKHMLKLDSELAAVQELQERAGHLCSNDDTNPAPDNGQSALPVLTARQVSQLQHVVQLLREQELQAELQAELAADVQQLADNTVYTEENFAYGSTSYTSWLKVFQHHLVHAAATSAMSGDGRTYMVWGSSTGWLLFYAATTYAWPCTGYELLPCLVRRSQAVAAQCGYTGLRVLADDLLTSCIAQVGVLVLTNQCWDADLMRKAAHKLDQELPDGAVVVEYTGACKACTHLVLVAQVQVPVSWNDAQTIHVWRVCKR